MAKAIVSAFRTEDANNCDGEEIQESEYTRAGLEF
jgi:hypothetical protein